MANKAFKLLQALHDDDDSFIHESLRDKTTQLWINNAPCIRQLKNPKFHFHEDHHFTTCLGFACKRNSFATMCSLVKAGAKINICMDSFGNSALHRVCDSDIERLTKATYLLELEPSLVHARDRSNSTPLHDCAEAGYCDVMALLLSHDAEVNAMDLKRMTPLHIAAQEGQLEAVKMLAQNSRCDVTLTNSDGKTAADVAREQDYQEIVNYLENIA